MCGLNVQESMLEVLIFQPCTAILCGSSTACSTDRSQLIQICYICKEKLINLSLTEMLHIYVVNQYNTKASVSLWDIGVCVATCLFIGLNSSNKDDLYGDLSLYSC